jgi:hypothetical protein
MTLTRTELAARLGVTPKTVGNWIESGCPTSVVDGEERLVFDDVERWRQAKGLTGRPGRPRRSDADDVPSGSAPAASPTTTTPSTTTPAFERPMTTKDAAARADAARKIAQARQQEHELQQERGLKDLDLAERIRAVTTADELVRLDLEVAALVGSGAMKHQRGQALRQLLAQAHRALAARETTADADEGLFLVTRQARELAQTFDKIGNGWRRRWLVEAVRLHLEQDRLELPDCNDLPAVISTLRLDPMGEPVDGDWPFAPPVVAPAVVTPRQGAAS